MEYYFYTMAIYTTEITSDKITSDNPLHQRLYRAYVEVLQFINGDVLELGCGEGRGIDLIEKKAKSFTALDKIESVINSLKEKYPSHKFNASSFPHMKNFLFGDKVEVTYIRDGKTKSTRHFFKIFY